MKTLSTYAFALMLWPVLLLAGDEQRPVDVIRNATNNVLLELGKAPEISNDPEQLTRVIHRHIAPHIDFVTLSRLALGKNWRQATREQREVFVREFSRLLVKVYSTALAGFTNQEVEYLPSTFATNKRRATVRSRILDNTQAPLAIDYSLRKVNNTWKIYDVKIEGISLAFNYRASFTEEISAHGIEGMLQRLAKKNKVKTQSQWGQTRVIF